MNDLTPGNEPPSGFSLGFALGERRLQKVDSIGSTT
jgi:hypothetical protein